MDKTALNGIVAVLPFDDRYIKVGKGKKTIKWNLMDANGNLVSANWFSSIERNASDKSIVAEVVRHKAAPIRTTFINTESLIKCSTLIDKIPATVFNFVDSNSITLIVGEKYVAKATIYGMTVYISKDGGIYGEDGTPYRLLLSTVDSERIFNAANAFNKKMHYDYKQAEGNRLAEYRKCKIALWGFYFFTEHNALITGEKTLYVSGTKKWTDDLIIRINPEMVSSDVLNAFIKEFGEAQIHDFAVAGEPNMITNSWHFNKTDVDRIIEFLGRF